MRTKKLVSIALALLMLLLPLACERKTTYRVIVENGTFIDLKSRYAEGEEVRLKTYIVYDASPTVTADGERLSPELDGYEYLVYTFIMPAHDVTVSYSLGGSDMMMMPFHIAYEDRSVIDPVESAYPGETVMLKVGLVFDKITDVYVNDEKIRQVNGPDEDFLYFAFEMPYEDVTVRVESRNISGADD
ncbi:MAG: hypothetical protein IKZ44_07315 [Clostridia bacterium]|nr:hypothetical protein [Clostridia bacterium]